MERQVTKLAVRPAVRVYQPVSNDTVNTKGKKFDTGALLLQRNDADFTRGTSTEALMGADSTFTFAKPAKGQEIYITQTTVRPADFFTGKLKVWCNTPFAILVNGKEQGTNVTPANFLDIGGGASAAVMSDSLSIVLSDPQVESVLINVYGGITSCEQVAKGILEALDELGSSKPIVVRFDGNAAAEGLNILAQAGRANLHVAQTMEEAAQQAARFAAKEVR